eukprot:CAMPEP_0194315746 /NCGR_PEP_ID=MMETSP0171-20130528/12532_1 /TAXON_ID=218684 /ORGANISM="Corethron pennatum, Strain L29A3" /LENGTH=279 /DNA_ID=CAMNT_0039071689 /DNA_START=107 /DNA_END=947 /DNA_ORIENTATION=+
MNITTTGIPMSHLFEKLGPVFTLKSNTHPGQYILTKGKIKIQLLQSSKKGEWQPRRRHSTVPSSTPVATRCPRLPPHRVRNTASGPRPARRPPLPPDPGSPPPSRPPAEQYVVPEMSEHERKHEMDERQRQTEHRKEVGGPVRVDRVDVEEGRAHDEVLLGDHHHQAQEEAHGEGGGEALQDERAEDRHHDLDEARPERREGEGVGSAGDGGLDRDDDEAGHDEEDGHEHQGDAPRLVHGALRIPLAAPEKYPEGALFRSADRRVERGHGRGGRCRHVL